MNTASYPFGMLMPGRTYTATNSYRYGFNGKENDNEIKGEGNQQDYGMRIYDTRLGRFLSVDPITKDYPELTPYQFASNRPIDGIDLDGLEYYFAADGKLIAKGKDPNNFEIRIAEDYKTVGDKKIVRWNKTLADVKFVQDNVKLLVGVIHHFTQAANVDLTKLYNKDVSVASLDDIGGNLPVSSSLYNDGDGGLQELMHAEKSSNKLNVTLNNGKINPKLKDANNLISTLFHEKTHLESEETSVWEHLDVYYKQVNQKSWENTTKKFKETMITNIKELISIGKAGNSQMSKKANNNFKKMATEWEKAFKQKLGKDYK